MKRRGFLGFLAGSLLLPLGRTVHAICNPSLARLLGEDQAHETAQYMEYHWRNDGGARRDHARGLRLAGAIRGGRLGDGSPQFLGTVFYAGLGPRGTLHSGDRFHVAIRGLRRRPHRRIGVNSIMEKGEYHN